MKKIIFLLTTLLLAAPSAFAQNFSFFAVAPSGQTLYYKIVNSSEVSVTYPGSYSDYYSGYTEPTGNLTIPSTVTNESTTYSVTSIGSSAFRDCGSLTSVTIPEGVTTIGNSAFSGCTSLSSVTIPEGVTSIGNYAFDDCNGLISVTIPSSVTSIGDDAFRGCSGLISVTIPSSVTSIGNGAFSGCSGLISVTIPSSVTTIGDYAFSSCSGLTSVSIPEGVTSIGNSAFSNCSGLTSVTIPNSVTSIGNNAFYYCDGLTSVSIPSSVTSIGNEAFKKCDGLTSISVESGNTVYDSREDCNAIIMTATNTLLFGCKNTVIPEGVTSIGNYAFYDCDGLTSNRLTSITIPSSVTSIGSYAFASCGLTSISIPSSVTFMGADAFANCTRLSYIECSATMPPTIGGTTFRSVPTSRPVYVPCGSLADYQSATGWSNFTNIQEGYRYTSTTANGQTLHFILYCNNHTATVVPENKRPPYYTTAPSGDLVIPSSITYGNMTYNVTSIGDSAFYNCSGLTSVSIPEGVTSIDNYAFYNCSGLTSVSIPEGVSSIGDYAFYNCANLTSIECMATTPPTIGGTYTFLHDPTNIPVHVPCGTRANYRSATGWSRFTNIHERSHNTLSVTSADNAMGSAAITTEPTCANNAATIAATPNCGYRFVRWEDAAGTTVSTDNPCTLAVTQDSALTAVFEATETTHIAIVSPSGHTLYYDIDCANNTAKVVPENNGYPYYTTEPTGDLTIPSSITVDGRTYPVTCIGISAFEGCRRLTSVTIPSSVTEIKLWAFCGCAFPSIIIPNSVTDIGDQAFRSCDNLESIIIPASVTRIHGNAFVYCSHLTSITVDAGNTAYDSRNNCNAIIETATNKLITGCNPTTIPNTVTTLGGYSFSMSQTHDLISIPASVTTIETDAFYGCNNHTTAVMVDAQNTHYDSRDNCNAIIESSTNKLIFGCNNTIIPNTVTAIGHSAFEGCYHMTSITIPSSVTNIESEAFRSSGLTDIVSLATVPPALSFLVFYNINDNASLYVPCGSLADYQAAEGWSDFTNIQEIFPYTLTASADSTIGSAAVTVAPTCANNAATIAATPNCGYRFVRWEDAAGTTVSTDNPCTITVTSDTALTAVFETGASQVALVCPSGQTLYYILDCTNLTATVVPENASYPYYTTSPTGDLTIPSSITANGHTYSVTSISNDAFNDCSNLTSVTISEGVTSIDAYAFTRCSSLTSVTIPSSVTSIGDHTFEFCSDLTSINIPSSITSIGLCAFGHCRGITSLTIPSSVTFIGYLAFNNCIGLTSISVESGNTVYDSRENCNALIETATNTLIAGCMNTVIPEGVISISDYAFDNCESLASVTIPSSVTHIGEYAFDACRGITSLTIEEGVTSIDRCAFAHCIGITSLTLPGSITTIGNGAFLNCSTLTSIKCLATVPPTIEFNGFYNVPTTIPVYAPCGKVTNYQAANGWSDFTNIQEVDGCSFTVTVAANDDSHGTVSGGGDYGNNTEATLTATPNCGYRFVQWNDGNTDNPRTVTVTEDVTYTATFDVANKVQIGGLWYTLDCANGTATVVPENDNDPYYNTFPTGDLVIPSSITYGSTTYTVTAIGAEAFEHCGGLTSVIIPNTVTTIGEAAFSHCTGLTSLTIPSSVTSIGFVAFRVCSGLTSIVVEAGNPVYDSRNNCNAIIETATDTLIKGCKTTVIPNTVTVIGYGSFTYCTGMTSLTIPNSVTTIGGYAFYGSDLTSITIPNSVTTIGEFAFWSSSLTSVDIPNSVTTIGGWAFGACANMTSVTIPSSVTSLSEGAFSNCSGLTSLICLAENPPTVGLYVFNNIPTNIPLYVPCGKVANYQAASDWSRFTNIQEVDGCSFTVTVAANDDSYGSVIGGGDYDNNTEVTIAATPNCGFRFVRWEDAAGNTVSTDNPITLAVTQDTALTAVFETSLFAATCPSGQTLFYKIIDPINNYVALTYPNEGQIDESSLNPWGGSLAHLLWDTIAPSGTLILPDTVTCNGTNYIVRAISAWTFLHCPITSLVMSNTIDSLASNAFLRCTSLTDITYSNALRYIGDNALRGCRLGNVVLPSSVRIIGVAALTNSQISSLTLNDSLEVLESWSLSQNPFTSLYIPASVKRCGTPCWYMGSLSTIVVDPDNPYYDSRNNCNAILNTMGEVLQACNATVLPEGTTRLYGDAFRGCRYSTFVVPNTVTDMAFHECHIGRLVLSSPTVKLSTLFLTVDTIQFLTDTPPVSINNYDGNFLSTPILVPCNSLSAYQADPVWGQFTNIQEQAPYTLSVTSAGNAMGSAAVTVEPTCANNNATITATPNSGYLFDHWSDGNSDNPRTLTVTQDTSLTAIFGIGATTDTAIHIHMELVGDSLFTQEGQSMVVTHPDSTYVKLRFDVEPAAERVEVLDQGQNVVATFLDATEEHVFRLTTGLYTIRAVFPGGATFEGTIDFVNELQE